MSAQNMSTAKFPKQTSFRWHDFFTIWHFFAFFHWGKGRGICANLSEKGRKTRPSVDSILPGWLRSSAGVGTHIHPFNSGKVQRRLFTQIQFASQDLSTFSKLTVLKFIKMRNPRKCIGKKSKPENSQKIPTRKKLLLR